MYLLKDGSSDLFEYLETKKVPILVFSAGLGNSVVAVLKQNKMMLSNVKVIKLYLFNPETIFFYLILIFTKKGCVKFFTIQRWSIDWVGFE